jgi:CRISPR system Cascade subunit CasD
MPRSADGKTLNNPVVTHRQFLLDARFGVLLSGDDVEVLTRAAEAVRNPVWGVWFGRKCCVPARPLFAGGPLDTEAEAWCSVLKAAGLPEDSPMAALCPMKSYS